MAKPFSRGIVETPEAGETAPPAAPPTVPENQAPPESPPPGDKPAASVELLTPEEWARKKGLLVEGPYVPEPHAKGFHSAAEQLHGWQWHALNYQAPEQTFRLSESDYDAALVAASQFPAKPAHKPALAPNYPEPVVPAHIAKACAAAEAKAAAAAEKKG